MVRDGEKGTAKDAENFFAYHVKFFQVGSSDLVKRRKENGEG